ncbi:head GIN domain-containing protein [Draconibacterium sp. IB214405]|uniref:head GIN domain-containing protein n=1 Tax=Draconibacterium sp. IB214405 TaxID=3097352 RepID=UPI002A0E64B8|nr:head GIN domain-containing protein [Draconibacterium sp. IB214405]MDX8341592.1 head GIN domain-containing protein [Draconibacterium sp. IB214405]
MKTRVLFLSLFVMGLFIASTVQAEEETRDVSSFSEISLRIPATVHLTQGSPQSISIEAKQSTLEDIITEVNGNKLVIRFPGKSIFQRNYNPGKIDIYITVPDVSGLGISGSGDILADEINARIIDLAVSGSGNIEIENLSSKKVKGSISGSGNIQIEGDGVADELSVSISGSGNFKGAGFEAEEVTVNTSGSGNSDVKSNGSVKARIAGSGSVYYKGNPSIDASVAGSGRVKSM